LIVSDDLIVGDDLGVTGLATIGETLAVTGVLTTTAATVFNGGFVSNAASTISTDGNEDTLVLKSNDADASAGPKLQFNRNSASPADGDRLGEMRFSGRNDAGQAVEYATFRVFAADVSDGTEDTEAELTTILAGTEVARMTMVAAETVFNQAGADLDFRVEGNEAFAFFVDGADSGVQMGGASKQTVGTNAPGRLLLVNDNNSNPELKLFRKDTSIGNGAQLGEITAYSNDTADNDIMPVASIGFFADGTFSATNNPSQILFSTTPASSETIRQVARFDAIGNFEMASTGGTIVTATAGTSNFRAGVNAGNSIASGGNYNVCVGDDAGIAITTADSNVAVGYNALEANQSANSNTAVGTNSMADHTQGVKNVGVGELSLHKSVNTNEQTAVGYEALRNSVGASGGGGNTALGYASMRDTTTGVYNTALGYAAGYDGVLTGNYNTYLGALAGRNLAGDEDNSTFIGYNSGSAMTSGEKNVILGSFTGNQNGLNIVTADNNIVISDGDGTPIINYRKGSDATRTRGQISGMHLLGIEGSIAMANGATISVLTNCGGNIVHCYDTGSGSGAIYFANYQGATSILASNGSQAFGVSASAAAFNLYKSTNSHNVTFQNNSGATRNLQIHVVGCSMGR